MTGARLPIAPSAPAGQTPIYVGRAAVQAGLKLDSISSPSHEGVCIVADEKRVLLAGQNGVSTVKAACRFLEALGCHYYMEGPLGESFPHTALLSVPKLDISESPGFISRRIWGSSWSGETLWKIWNGDGGVDLNTAHSWSRYEDASWAQTHPEWFALRGGRRQVDATAKKHSDWVCTSNAGLREAFAANVNRRIAAGDLNPSLSPPDGVSYCQCPECQAQDDPATIEPSSGRPSITNRYLDFFNAISSRVQEEYPNSLLSFYAYADYSLPPTGGLKANPNLIPWIAPLRYCRVHHTGDPRCPGRFRLAEDIAKWGQASRQLGLRCYNFNAAELTVPFSMITTWKDDMPFYQKNKITAISNETLGAWNISGPHMYLSARLAYAPNADADALMDDYFSGFYGPRAAPFMKEYWMGIDQAFQNLDTHTGGYYEVHRVYNPGMLAKCRELLNKAAQAAAGDQIYAQRVAMNLDGFHNAEEYIALREALNRGEFVRAKEILDAATARSDAAFQAGYGTEYTGIYLKRYMGTVVGAGLEATKGGRVVIGVLPDEWRLEYDEAKDGEGRGYARADFDDTHWRPVRTYSDSLDAQGLPNKQTVMWYRAKFTLPPGTRVPSLLLGEVDGKSTVFVNGQKLVEDEKARSPFEVDITTAVHPGENSVAVRVDHSQITELALGGIIRPVYLIGSR